MRIKDLKPASWTKAYTSAATVHLEGVKFYDGCHTGWTVDLVTLAYGYRCFLRAGTARRIHEIF